MEIIKTYNDKLYDTNMILGSRFSVRIKKLNDDELKDLIIKIHSNNKVAYVNVNQIFHNEEILKLEDYLKLLISFNTDYIIFSDFGVYNIAKKLGIENKLIYNPDTLLTNYLDINLYKELNIYGCFISPILNIEEIKEIIKNKDIKLFYIGVGHINIFYSKRRLIDTYFDFVNKDYSDGAYILKEETRQANYPFIQDEKGCHMFTPYAMSYKKYSYDLEGLDYIVYDDYLIDDLNFAYENGIPGFLEKNIVYRKECF